EANPSSPKCSTRSASRAARSTSAVSASRSRSTAGSRSRPRHSRQPRATTSSWRAARSSTPTTRSTPRSASAPPHGRPRPDRVMALVAKILTVSDGVADGTREDRSGRALADRLVEGGFAIIEHRVSPDGTDNVATALRELATGFAGLVVTTGGTGFGPRDLTPEGTRQVIE